MEIKDIRPGAADSAPTSLLNVGGTLFFAANDGTTGVELWKSDGTETGTVLVKEILPGSASPSPTPGLFTEFGGALIFRANDGVTGQELWKTVERKQHSGSNRPVVGADGVIYTATGLSKGQLMAIRPGGSGDVTDSHIAWRYARAVPTRSSVLLVDGLIYMVGDVGVLTVVDARTGERVHQERVGGVYTASPVAGDGKIYLVSEDGETLVVGAGRAPRVLARNRLDARQLASPAIAAGRLFIRSDDTLYAIGK